MKTLIENTNDKKSLSKKEYLRPFQILAIESWWRSFDMDLYIKVLERKSGIERPTEKNTFMNLLKRIIKNI